MLIPYFRLTFDEYKILSPLVNYEKIARLLPLKILIYVGKYDAPNFISMSQEMFENLQRLAESTNSASNDKNTRLSVQFHLLNNEDHFSMITNLLRNESELLRIMVDFVNGSN